MWGCEKLGKKGPPPLKNMFLKISGYNRDVLEIQGSHSDGWGVRAMDDP